jgi:RNA polymerase sigma-70 factor (ECF subfamily)
MDSEKELMVRCRRGEAEAWDALFDTHYPAVARFVWRLSSSFQPDDVEEICQEVFLAVIRNIAHFHGQSSFRTWLFRIAANKARDHVDKQNAAKRGGGQAVFSLDAEPPGDGARIDPPAPALPPDFALMNEERMALVREALDQLGDPCRAVIELRYFGDLSYEEIARELQLNAKTVSSRLAKCLDKLEGIAARLLSRENFPPTSV